MLYIYLFHKVSSWILGFLDITYNNTKKMKKENTVLPFYQEKEPFTTFFFGASQVDYVDRITACIFQEASRLASKYFMLYFNKINSVARIWNNVENNEIVSDIFNI